MKNGIFILFLLSFSSFIYSQQSTAIPYTIEDRDTLTRIETKLGEMDKRMEQIDKRIDQTNSFIAILAGVFSVISIGTIGFAFWDRRSTFKPIESKMKRIDELWMKLEPGANTLYHLQTLIDSDTKEILGLKNKIELISEIFRVSGVYDKIEEKNKDLAEKMKKAHLL